MSRATYVHFNGQIVEKSEAIAQGYGQSSTWVKGVQSDTMDATVNHANGRVYDSKAKFRAATRAHGMVEVGTEKLVPRKFGPPKLDNRQRADDIKKAIYQLKNGMA